jgi:beta-glucosidase
LSNLNEVVEEAKASDVIILCIGEDTYCETQGNISNLCINENQLNLGKALANIQKPIILVYLGGRPRVITPLVEASQGVLLAFLPGNRGSEAIRDILFGEYNPNGRLPITYPLHPQGFTTYDHYSIEVLLGNTYECLYPFGHGLSYSKFAYEDLKLSKTKLDANDELKVEVSVKNLGPRDGKEVVMLFLNDEYGSVPRPIKQLKKFEKIDLKVNETKNIEFTLSMKDLSFIGLDNKRIVEPGGFNVYVGNLSKRFELLTGSASGSL